MSLRRSGSRFGITKACSSCQERPIKCRELCSECYSKPQKPSLNHSGSFLLSSRVSQKSLVLSTSSFSLLSFTTTTKIKIHDFPKTKIPDLYTPLFKTKKQNSSKSLLYSPPSNRRENENKKDNSYESLHKEQTEHEHESESESDGGNESTFTLEIQSTEMVERMEDDSSTSAKRKATKDIKHSNKRQRKDDEGNHNSIKST
eukprot:TRINITY_DN2852_c0_g1_i1.p1 TRINITY_DN2852_c0_g1~~TRINITY_DN2852_c0_g1_i1.p1  ORF type:complete len:202 (-),score=29.67 TRINITY_DN2852_c0_g1_i1:68-673(-)